MKRFFSVASLSIFSAVGIVASSPVVSGEDKTAAAPAQRTFAFTYKLTVPKPAAGSKHLDAWVPTPLEDELQKVADLKVTATSDGKDVPFEQTVDAEYGNRMVHVGIDAPAADVVIQWTATVTRTADTGNFKRKPICFIWQRCH